MACPSFGSSSEVSLWYAIDPDPSQELPDGSSGGAAFTWYSVPMTGESISSNLTATISEQITSKRSYAGSKLSQGEVTGSFNFECQASQFVYNMLVCVTQADVELSFGAGVAGTSAVNSGITVSGSDVEIDLIGLTPEVFATYSVVISSVEHPFTSVSVDLEYIAAGLAEVITSGGEYTATVSGEVITIEEAAGNPVAFRSYSKSEFSPGAFINNGSSKKCLVFLKAVRRPDNTYDYYPFRGVQIGSLSLEIQPSSLVAGTCNLMGVKPDAPIEETAPPSYWSFEDPQGIAPLMSGVDSLKEFYIRSSAGVDTGLTMQSLAISLDNQLRQQPAVGINSPFAAGIASGRFMMTFSGSAYYSSPRIYKDFIADKALSVSGNLVDSAGSGFKFSSASVKVTQGGLPMAESPDQDLLITTEFRAFESGDQGTVSLVRLPDGPGTYAWIFARILNDGSIGAYFPGDQSMLYFEDSAATIPATLDGVVGAMASADGAIVAVQATTANKPFLRRTPTTGIYWLDSNTSTGALVATFGSSLGSACTVVRAGPYGVTFEETVTIGTTYIIAPPFQFNSDVLIINRALTVAEKALLTQYMGRSVPQLSAEIIVNGEFTTDISGWNPANADVTVSWDAGVLVANRPSVSGAIYALQTPGYTHTQGNQYIARAKNAGAGNIASVIMYTGGSTNNRVHPPLTSLLSGEDRTVVGQSNVASDTLTVRLGTNSVTTGERRYDNISLKRIL